MILNLLTGLKDLDNNLTAERGVTFMVKEEQRLHSTIRDKPPCCDCSEKFIACHDHCPKDARGEFGYKAWKAEIKRVKKARRDFIELKTEHGYKRRWVNGKGDGD